MVTFEIDPATGEIVLEAFYVIYGHRDVGDKLFIQGCMSSDEAEVWRLQLEATAGVVAMVRKTQVRIDREELQQALLAKVAELTASNAAAILRQQKAKGEGGNPELN